MNKILTAFLTDAKDYSLEPIKKGLIHQTYLVKKSQLPSFILQQINTSVFADPIKLAQNYEVIRKAILSQDSSYPVLTFISTLTGAPYFTDEDKNIWRLIHFIPNSISIDKVETTAQVYQTARSFAQFSAVLQQSDSSLLQPAIPNFHHLPLRFGQFESALMTAHPLKKAKANAAVQFLMDHHFIVVYFEKMVKEQLLPIRWQHCDTKISNILFDTDTQLPLCVIDWDTVMPGYFLSDLGDMIRTMAFSAGENETDLSNVAWKEDFYLAIIKGYTEGMNPTAMEKKWVPYAGPFMIYQQALRFVTDYLNGDIYYSIDYPGQNLDRALNQCHILSLLLEEVKLTLE